MFHNESLPEGLQEVADSLSPKFAITCIVLFSLCGLSAIVLHRHDDGFVSIDWVRSKPTLALAGKIDSDSKIDSRILRSILSFVI